MAFRLDPPQSTCFQIQHLAVDRLENALEHLSKITADEPASAVTHVHAVRRRCKQVRAVARLVRPALGKDFAPFNQTVRDAARALAPLRNAHVAEGLLRALDAPETTTDIPAPSFDEVASAVDGARQHLRLARRLVEQWALPDGFGPLGSGLERTYRRGRRGWEVASGDPTTAHLHEWRKDVKDLWYQLRLLRAIAPSMLDPFIDQLDVVGEDLGHHHDITLLLDGLANERRHLEKRRKKDPDAQVAAALADVELAADRADDARHQLGRSALRNGSTVFAEEPAPFVARIEAYWDITNRSGPERGPLHHFIKSKGNHP
ncbi:MAG: CHAD domain-containing protein [Acidimicrobiales bacterium]